MYKLLSLSIFLSFFAVQNASALTLKKGETLGSGWQINSNTDIKSAEATDTDETVIYLAWGIACGGKPTPVIEAVDRLVFPIFSQAGDVDGVKPTIRFNDMTDDYILQGRDKLKFRLLSEETLSVQGHLEVERGSFFSINSEVSISSDELVLPLPNGDKLVLFLHMPGPALKEWKSDCDGKADRKVPKMTDLDCVLKQASRNIELPEGTIKSHHLASRDAGMIVTGFPG